MHAKFLITPGSVTVGKLGIVIPIGKLGMVMVPIGGIVGIEIGIDGRVTGKDGIVGIENCLTGLVTTHTNNILSQYN